MKKFLFILTIICTATLYAQNTYNPVRLYTVAQLQQDFTQLRAKLEHMHANFYLYTNKAALDHFFDSLYLAINKPMTCLQFYALITPLSSQIKNGHSYILPSGETRAWFNKHEVFLPLHIIWLDEKMFVDMNGSNDTTLKDGTQILSINGMPAKDIMQALLTRQVRDGYNITYPTWILNNYFREYYSYIFGHPDRFVITYKHKGNAAAKTIVQALPKDSISFYMHKKYAARLPAPGEKAITLTFNANNTIATLTIKTFDDDDLKETYQQNFKTAIEDCFVQIKQHAITNLILDLRNNQGGDPPNGIILLSYLLNNPFEMIHTGPMSVGTFQPVLNNAYSGALYVLINGGSFSNTAMVSACLARNKRGIFIGEETGGNQVMLTGDPETFTLPATKIDVEIATVPYLLTGNPALNNGHGVMPAYNVSPSILDIINNNDAVYNFAIALINKSK